MKISRMLAVMAWLIVLSCIGVSPAQAHTTPCGSAQGDAPWPGTNGLWLVENGSPTIFDDWTVYDSNLGVCWLSDANLAGNPAAVKMLMPYVTACSKDGSSTTINPDGTMDYETAKNWVCALNSYNGF